MSDPVEILPYENPKVVILTEHNFFEDLRRLYELVNLYPSQEWVQYGPTARVFHNFCATLRWKSASIGLYPQISFVPPNRQPDRRGVRRSPDHGLLLVEVAEGTPGPPVKNRLVTTGLVSWIEEKPFGIKDVFHGGAGLEYHLKQLNEQAIFALSTYEGHGFYAFLIIKDSFSLLYYPRPPNWTQLVESWRAQGRARRQLPTLASSLIHIIPTVILANEPMFDDLISRFSLQMLYAFQIISNFTVLPHIQPSFFRAPERIERSAVCSSIGERKTDRDSLRTIIAELGKENPLDDEEHSEALLIQITSGDGIHGDRSAPYRGSVPRYETSPAITRARSASLASQRSDNGRQDSDTDPNKTPRPSRTKEQEPESPTEAKAERVRRKARWMQK